MTSAISNCRRCGKPGRWGFNDDWCHEERQAAIDCPLEGWNGGNLDHACPTCSAPAGQHCHGFGICAERGYMVPGYCHDCHEPLGLIAWDSADYVFCKRCAERKD